MINLFKPPCYLLNLINNLFITTIIRITTNGYSITSTWRHYYRLSFKHNPTQYGLVYVNACCRATIITWPELTRFRMTSREWRHLKCCGFKFSEWVFLVHRPIDSLFERIPRQGTKNTKALHKWHYVMGRRIAYTFGSMRLAKFTVWVINQTLTASLCRNISDEIYIDWLWCRTCDRLENSWEPPRCWFCPYALWLLYRRWHNPTMGLVPSKRPCTVWANRPQESTWYWRCWQDSMLTSQLPYGQIPIWLNFLIGCQVWCQPTKIHVRKILVAKSDINNEFSCKTNTW